MSIVFPIDRRCTDVPGLNVGVGKDAIFHWFKRHGGRMDRAIFARRAVEEPPMGLTATAVVALLRADAFSTQRRSRV